MDQGITKMGTPSVFPFQDHPANYRMLQAPGIKVRTARACRHTLLVTQLNPSWLVTARRIIFEATEFTKVFKPAGLSNTRQ